MMRRTLALLLFVVCFYGTFATAYYVGGPGASDNNPGTASLPFATIQKAANVAVAGDVVNIRSGTYRETVVPANSGTQANPIIYQADNGARVIISGLEPISETGWTVHNGSIYKKAITLPVDGFNKDTFSNTQILANQLFKDGEPQIEARWPKMNNFSDMLDRSSYRSITNSTSNTITDASIPPNVTGALCWVGGWYVALTGYVTGQAGSTITWNQPQPDIAKRKRFFLTGKLNLLTQQKEFHYEAGTLYFWQQGGGSPTGLEYKARNYGFNLRANSYITVNGLEFIGCDPVVASTSSNTIVIDNIRASYLNHAIRVNWTNSAELYDGLALVYWNARQTGIRLLGPNSIIRNSELNWGIQAVWLGQNGIMDNCLAQGFGMDGNYGCGVTLWDHSSNQKILNNTMYNMGRSCMDWGALLHDNKFNVEVAYNDWYDFERLSADAGASYAGGYQNTDGSVMHHNWIHDSKNLWSGTGEPEEGVNAGIYWDMGSGWSTLHHNVIWNCNGNAVFSNPCYEGMNHAKSNLYNNTFVDNYSSGGFYGPGGNHYMQSYKNVCSSPLDKMRNNIYGDEIMAAQNSVQVDNANSVMENTNPSYLQSGTGGLRYRISASSPARNLGVHIPGITDGYLENAPDAGAYEFGDPNPWVPGYTPVPVTTTPNIPPVVSITSPANNSSFTAGTPITISANASDADGSVYKVEFFYGTTKVGEDLSSPYSIVWNNPPIGTNPLTAKATDNQNRVTTSSPVTITVNGNAAPTASITGPSNNAQFTAGIPITITATASDANGSVTKVEFFNGTTKLGEDLTSPYNFVWNNAPVGTLALTVKATDNENSATTSAIVTIKVNAKTPPTVAITGPSNNAQFISGTSVTITATASDANGSVTKVEFFNGTTKLGQDLTSPYSFVWNNAPTGTHALTAKATDNESNATTSAIVTIIVNANTPPTVAITGPSNNSQFITGTPVTIAASASDQNGSVTKVEFFNGTIKLGEDLTAPYSFVWKNAPAGKYAITAKATDNLNTVAVSKPATITIVVNTAPTVTITGPSDNAQFTAGAAITIAATASDANGSVTKVEFFNGTAKLGEDPTSPYGFLWNNVPVGDYSITAKATDNLGAVGTSAAVSIHVIAANTPPVVSITSPSNNTSFLAGSSITIKANASDPNGAVSKVEFFSGSTKLGEDLTSPYRFVWNNVPEGNYSIKVKATDNLNAVTSSKSVSISIVSPISPTAFAGPDETLLLPENEVTLQGSGTAADGSTVTYEWVQLSGPDVATLSNTAAPEVTLTNLIAGKYEFELTVTDQNGLTGKDQIQISVVAEEIAMSEIPRYFSPNDDGINDFWEWPQSEVFDNSLLMIFNRFGQQIYEAISYKNNWDGKMNGKALQEDAYYYVIRLLNNTDIKGAVRIIR